MAVTKVSAKVDSGWPSGSANHAAEVSTPEGRALSASTFRWSRLA